MCLFNVFLSLGCQWGHSVLVTTVSLEPGNVGAQQIVVKYACNTTFHLNVTTLKDPFYGV